MQADNINIYSLSDIQDINVRVYEVGAIFMNGAWPYVVFLNERAFILNRWKSLCHKGQLHEKSKIDLR